MREKSGIWLIDRFYGGLSDGSKRGITGSFRWGEGLDFRTDPDALTALRDLAKDSGTTITDEIKWIITEGTNIWFYGDTGKVYKRNSSGTYSLEKTISDSSGNGMAIFDDFIYFASDTSLHRYVPLSDSSPGWEFNFLENVKFHAHTYFGDATTYTPPTSISETASHKVAFITDSTYNTIVVGCIVTILSKGTGDWTVTLHDSSNNTKTAVTITNSSLPSTAGVYRFVFPTPIKLEKNTSYHLHITSTVADGTMQSADGTLTNARITIPLSITEEDLQYKNINEGFAGYSYTLPTTLNESEQLTFTPEKYYVSAVSIQYSAIVGSGNITVELHDSNNKVLGTKTKTFSSALQTHSWEKFEFDSPIRVTPGATYHIHVYGGSGMTYAKAYVQTSSSYSSMYYMVHYPILNNHEYHPMLFFPANSSLVIGNGNFLAVYDGIAYRTSGQREGSERLSFAKEENVRCIDIVGDHLAIGVWKGDSIDDHGHSHLYFWDGTSTFITAFKRVVGEINAIKTGDDGLLYVWHGGDGKISIYNGAINVMKRINGLERNKYVEIYPGAVTTHKGIVKFGVSASDSSNIKRGIYSFGRANKNYPRVLNYDNTISTGNNGSTVSITAMLGIGPSKFFVAWKDGSNYGIDIIDTSTDQDEVIYESLVFDAGIPYLQKKSTTIRLLFEPLTTGQSIEVYAKKNRDSSWNLVGTANTVGSFEESFAYDERWTELELQIKLKNTEGIAPKLFSVATFFDIIPDPQINDE